MSLITADLKGQLCNVILTLFKIFKYQKVLGLPDKNVFINGDYYCDGGLHPEQFKKTNVGDGFIYKRLDFFKKVEPFLKHKDEYQKIISNGNFQKDIKNINEARVAIKNKKDLLLYWLFIYPDGNDDLLLFKKMLFNDTFFKNGISRISKIGSSSSKCVGMHIRRNDFSFKKICRRNKK